MNNNIFPITEKMIKKCKYCGEDIVWNTNRKGKYYPINASKDDIAGYNGSPAVNRIDVHNCRDKRKQIIHYGKYPKPLCNVQELRGYLHFSDDEENVNCKRCLKKLEVNQR